MKNKAAILFAPLLLGSYLGCSRPSMEVGKPAPGFKLADLQGRKISLEDYRGKIVLLDFWATWCGPCRLSMPQLERIQFQYPNDVALLAINLQEPPDVVRSYVQERDIRSRVLLDEEGEVGRVYMSDSIPMQVLIDQQGVVRDVSVGFSARMGDRLRQQIEKLRAVGPR